MTTHLAQVITNKFLVNCQDRRNEWYNLAIIKGGDDMAKCVPMKDLKDTAKFAETVETAGEPVVVTRNGKEAFVAMTCEQFASYKEEALKARFLEMILEGEADVRNGNVVDAFEFLESLEARHEF